MALLIACAPCQTAKKSCDKNPEGCSRCLKSGTVCLPGTGNQPGPKPRQRLPNDRFSLQAAHAGNDVSMDAARNEPLVASASFHFTPLTGQGLPRSMGRAAHSSFPMGQKTSHVRPQHSPLLYPIQRSAAPAPTLAQEAFPVQSARYQRGEMLGPPTAYMDVPQMLMSPTPGYFKSSPSLPIGRNYGPPLAPFETGPNLRSDYPMNAQSTLQNPGYPAPAFEAHHPIGPDRYQDIGIALDQYDATITLPSPPPMPGYLESNNGGRQPPMLESGTSGMFAGASNHPPSGLRVDTSYSHHFNTGLAGSSLATGAGASLPRPTGCGSIGTIGNIMPGVSPSTPGMTVTPTSSNDYHAPAFEFPAPSLQHETTSSLTAGDYVMNFGPGNAAPAGGWADPYPQHDQGLFGAWPSMPMDLDYFGDALSDPLRAFEDKYSERRY
jgi:hypothetical protein